MGEPIINIFTDIVAANDDVAQWYNESSERVRNPLLVQRIDEQNKPIFKFVVASLIVSKYDALEIKQAVDKLTVWYEALPEKRKKDEFILIDILITLYETYNLRLSDDFDSGNLFKNLGRFLGNFFYNFDEETLRKLDFNTYFMYGLTDRDDYQNVRFSLIKDFYGINAEKRMAKKDTIIDSLAQLESLREPAAAATAAPATWYDSPLFFLRKLSLYLNEENREKLDALNELRQENISLFPPQFQHEKVKEIFTIDLVIAMIEHLKHYKEAFNGVVTSKLNSITSWLATYPFIYLNKKGDIFNRDFLNLFINYYNNLVKDSPTIVKCELLYWFLLKLRTVKLKHIEEGFDSMTSFYDAFDLCKVCQSPDATIFDLKTITPNDLSKDIFGMYKFGPFALNSINYRKDYDLQNGFNVAGVNINLSFWKYVDRMAWLDDTKYPIGYFLGLINSHCVEMPISAEGFYEHVKDHYGVEDFTLYIDGEGHDTFSRLKEKFNKSNPNLEPLKWEQGDDMVIRKDDEDRKSVV